MLFFNGGEQISQLRLVRKFCGADDLGGTFDVDVQGRFVPQNRRITE